LKDSEQAARTKSSNSVTIIRMMTAGPAMMSDCCHSATAARVVSTTERVKHKPTK